MSRLKKTILFVIISSCSIASAMSFNELPYDIINTIISVLAKNVGTVEVINQKDIPIIIKYIKALSLTNRKLQAFINSETITQKCSKKLTKRFKLEPLDAMIMIDSPGSRHLLRNHFQATTDGLFDVILSSLNIADTVRSEFTEQAIAFDEKMTLHDWVPNVTKQGLFLSVGKRPFLHTPWGCISLFEGTGFALSTQYIAFFQEFFKRYKLSFVQPTKNSSKECYYSIPENLKEQLTYSARNLEDVRQKLTSSELWQYVGTSCLIYGDNPTHYGILKMDNTILPEPQLSDSKANSSLNWSKMLIFLREEHNRERGKPIKRNYSGSQQVGTKNSRFISFEQIPQQCLQVLEELLAQPFLTITEMQNEIQFESRCNRDFTKEQKFLHEKNKILRLENEDDCSLLEMLLRKCLQCFNPYTLYFGHSPIRFGYQKEPLDIQKYKSGGVHYGLLLSMGGDFNLSLAHVSSLFLHEIEREISTFKQGWHYAKLRDNANIYASQSEEEWQLIVHEPISTGSRPYDALLNDKILLSGLSKALGINASVDIGVSDKKICMWIKKKHFDKVVRTLNLKIEQEKS